MYYVSLQPVLLAICLVVFGTKNGRTLVIQSLRDAVHLVPITIRRFFLLQAGLIPVKLSRWCVYLFTQPIGNETKWIQTIVEDTWKGVWIGPNLTSVQHAQDMAIENDLVILYIHGGGFGMGHATMYMATFQLMIHDLFKRYGKRSSILSVEYSLSPENVWPKACYECIDAYRYLVHTLGISSSKIMIMGDSAGGNLVASTLLILRDQRNHASLRYLPPLTLPAGAALLSPWVDLAPVKNQAKKDTLSQRQLESMKSNYISSDELLLNPLVSPLHGDFKRMCPLFISYGENELLKPSIEQFVLNMKRDACPTQVLMGKNESHIWLVYSLMATSKQVYKRDCSLLTDWISSVVH